MMNEHEAHERDMQWDDAGDGAGLPETGERDAVQGIEPGAERHAAEYKAVALGDAVAADAAGTATSVIGNVPVPTAAEGKTEPAAQEGAGAAGQQAADDEGMQFLDNPAWDIPDVMFPSMGGVKDASSGSGPSYGAPSPYVPLPEPEDTVRPVHGSASDPLGLEGVSDIPTVPEEEEPQGNNDVTMVIQPLSAFPTPTQSVPPTAGMTPQTVPLSPEAGAAVPPHGSGEPRRARRTKQILESNMATAAAIVIARRRGRSSWGARRRWADSRNERRHMQNQNELDQAAGTARDLEDQGRAKAFSRIAVRARRGIKPAAAGSARRCVISIRPFLETLNSAVAKKATPASEPVSCDVAWAPRRQLERTMPGKNNRDRARQQLKTKANVAKATKAVNDGKAEKVEFIKHELQTAVTGAQKIYDDSKGVVLDDSTRPRCAVRHRSGERVAAART
ncbi:MAG: hypothetical protein ACLVEF_06505 [Bifidobacterium bifidum]